MLTIFAHLKPMRGRIAVAQRNACQSWMALDPACQVILSGNEAGVASLAAEFGLLHIPHIDRTACGTPLVPSLFEAASYHGEHRLLCYVNADIILMSDFARALRRIADGGDFLLTDGDTNFVLYFSDLIQIQTDGAIIQFLQAVLAPGIKRAPAYLTHRPGLFKLSRIIFV